LSLDPGGGKKKVKVDIGNTWSIHELMAKSIETLPPTLTNLERLFKINIEDARLLGKMSLACVHSVSNNKIRANFCSFSRLMRGVRDEEHLENFSDAAFNMFLNFY
jgi:hypothetical protein